MNTHRFWVFLPDALDKFYFYANILIFVPYQKTYAVKSTLQKENDIMTDALLDAAIDSMKLLPFLFITYLIMEYIEEKTRAHSGAMVGKAGRLAPLAGGLLGVIPQCGFSAAAANLYAGHVITPGTLIAIFLSTSDEMLPIFISEHVAADFIIEVLVLKMVLGIIAGLGVDFVYFSCLKKQLRPIDIHHICENEHCHCHEHGEEGEKNHHGIWRPALKHTVNVFVFILIFSVLLNLLFYFIGEDSLKQLIYNRPIISEFLAGIVGLVPNCAASVVLTQLYLEGVLSFGAMMSGLLVGAGVGVLVLFKINDNRKENFVLVGVLYGIGVLFGCIIELFL